MKMKEIWMKIWEGMKAIGRFFANKNMWLTVGRFWIKVGKFCLRAMTIPGWLIVLLVIFTAVALCYTFIYGDNTSVMAAIVYAVSAYTLGTVCVATPKIYRCIRGKVDNSKAVNYVMNLDVTQRYRNDKIYRGKMVLYQGVITNMAFAVFKLIVSWIYRSVWFGAVGFYYVALTGLRYMLIKYMKQADIQGQLGQEQKKALIEYRGFRLCGWLLIVCNVALGGMTFMMVIQGYSYSYPGYIIFVSAGYAFYSLTMSIINMIRYRKLNNPILTGAKTVNFAGALVSMLTMQTAMLSQFGGGDVAYASLMNGLTGGGIYIIILTFAVLIIINANKNLKEIKNI